MSRSKKNGRHSVPRPEDLKRPLRVLLCPDRPGWAFDNIANNIIRQAPDHFQITKFYMGDPATRELSSLFEQLAAENIDVLHLFWREDLFELLRPATILKAAKRLKISAAEVIDIICSCTLTTSVYDHLYLQKEQIFNGVLSYHMIDAYSVSSQKLEQIYSSVAEYPRPDAVITDGVDLATFKPGKSAQQNGLKTPVIGWVGNSAWGNSEGGDPKGYHRLFLPAIDILRQMNIPIKINVADAQSNRRTFAEMPDYYRSINLLACTSAMEGTPNPVLEAMATGLPIVSTDVGIVCEAFGAKQSKFICHDPTPEAFANLIKTIIEDKQLSCDISTENLAQIRSWSWKKRTEPWWSFWLSAVERSTDPRLAQRRVSAIVQSCLNYQSYFEHQSTISAFVYQQTTIFRKFWRRNKS